MKLSLAGLILIALGALIVLTPWYIFPVCEVFGDYAKTATGKLLLMPCSYTARAEFGVGSLMSLSGAILLVAKGTETKRAVGTVSTGLGALAILFPTAIIGVCADPGHPCVTGTEPALVLLGALAMLLSLIVIIRR